MPSNKDRLYVGLYARGGKPKMIGQEDKYHWGLIVGPKVEPENGKGMRYHAKETPNLEGTGSQWVFEERECSLAPSSMLLVRIIVGKVTHGNRTVEILRNTPIRQGQPGWNCVSWVKEALEMLESDTKALGTHVVEWEKVRNGAMYYCQQKKDQHRFDGQGNSDRKRAPTYDLMDQKEINV